MLLNIWKLVLFLLIIIASPSCCKIFGKKYIITDQQLLIAKNPSKYKYKNASKNESSNPLKFNGIYVREFHGNINFKDSVGIVYMRLFNSGHVFIGELRDEIPQSIELNSLNNGFGGYYKIEKGLIKIEYFIERDCGTRMLNFGIIQNNSINMYTANPKTFFGQIPANSKTVIWKFIQFDHLEHPEIIW